MTKLISAKATVTTALMCICLVFTACIGCNDTDIIKSSKKDNNLQEGENCSIVGTWELIDAVAPGDIMGDGSKPNVGKRIIFYEDGKVDHHFDDDDLYPTNWFPTYTISDDSLFCLDNDVISIGYVFNFSPDCNLLYTDLFIKHNCDTCSYKDILRVPYYAISGIFKRVR